MRHTAAKSFDQDIKTRAMLINKKHLDYCEKYTFMYVQEGFEISVLLRGQTRGPTGQYGDRVGTVEVACCLQGRELVHAIAEMEKHINRMRE